MTTDSVTSFHPIYGCLRRRCCGCMQPADITIVKSMKNPPFGVKLVMSAVCVMKGIPPEKVVDPMGTGQRVSSVPPPHAPDLQNILRQSYDYLKTIMSKLRSTYDGRIIYQTSYERMANSYVRSTCKIVRLSQDNLAINRKIFCKSGPIIIENK